MVRCAVLIRVLCDMFQALACLVHFLTPALLLTIVTHALSLSVLSSL